MPMGRRDANEPEIRQALALAGYEVIQLEDKQKAGLLDLLVIGPMPCPDCGHLFEQARLLEVKTARGTLRPEQSAMLSRHPLASRLARTVIDALAHVGRQAQVIKRASSVHAQTLAGTGQIADTGSILAKQPGGGGRKRRP